MNQVYLNRYQIRLCSFVNYIGICNTIYFSDLVVKLDGAEVQAHRFVLAARSDNWGVNDLGQCTHVDISGKYHRIMD